MHEILAKEFARFWGKRLHRIHCDKREAFASYLQGLILKQLQQHGKVEINSEVFEDKLLLEAITKTVDANFDWNRPSCSETVAIGKKTGVLKNGNIYYKDMGIGSRLITLEDLIEKNREGFL